MRCNRACWAAAIGCFLAGASLTALAQQGAWKNFNDGGWQQCRKGEHANACELLHLALKEAEKFSPTDPRLALTLSYLAFASYKDGKAEFEKHAQRALAIYKDSDDKAADKGKGLNALGLLFHAQKDYDKAQSLYKQATALEEKRLGGSHAVVAQLLSNQALVLEAQGRYEEAEPLLQRAVDALALDGKQEPQLAAALLHATGFYRAWGKDAKAGLYAERAVQLRRKSPGAQDLDLAQSLNTLGTLYFDLRNYADAEPVLKEALAIRTKAQGSLAAKEQVDLAASQHNLGSLYLARNKTKEAEALLASALTIRRQANPRPNPHTAATLHTLAIAQLGQKRYLQAESNLKDALAMKEKVHGSASADAAASAEALASVYIQLNKPSDAEWYFKHALAGKEQALGADHRSVAATLHNLANFYRDQGQPKYVQSAEPLYRRALAIKEKALGAEHAGLAPLLDNYAALLSKIGKKDEAMKLTERAKAIRASPAAKS